MPKDEKIDRKKRAEDLATAEKIKLLFGFACSLDLERLKESRKNLSDAVSMHAAIGIADPVNYQSKQEKAEAISKRLDALINLIEVLWGTEKDIVQSKKNQKYAEDFARGVGGILGV